MTILQALILVGVAWVACVLVICAWFMARDALAKGRADAADEEDRDWSDKIEVTSGYRTTALPADHVRSDHWPDRIDQRRD